MFLLNASVAYTAIEAEPRTRAVTDAVGRVVTVPTTVTRVATIGPAPVLDSLILALGKGSTIVSGLPPFAQTTRYRFLQRFLPGLAQQTAIQSGLGAPNIERLFMLRPDVIFVMDRAMAEHLSQFGFAVVTLQWTKTEDVKYSIRVLAEIYGVTEQAEAYLSYFDQTIALVQQAVSTFPEGQRTKVLYCSPRAMSQPHLIAEWWIQQAGGLSVTRGPRLGEVLTFSMEQVLHWNPEVILVPSKDEIAHLYGDSRWSAVEAIRHRQVYALPVGAHAWGNRTSELPLTVLWAAKRLYPDFLPGLDMAAEAQRFYRQFFGVQLSTEEVQDLLDERS